MNMVKQERQREDAGGGLLSRPTVICSTGREVHAPGNQGKIFIQQAHIQFAGVFPRFQVQIMQFAASGIVAQLAGRIAQRVEHALRRIAFHPLERAGGITANRPLQAVCRQRELARTFQRLAERFPGLLPRGRDDFSIVRGILRALRDRKSVV